MCLVGSDGSARATARLCVRAPLGSASVVNEFVCVRARARADISSTRCVRILLCKHSLTYIFAYETLLLNCRHYMYKHHYQAVVVVVVVACL